MERRKQALILIPLILLAGLGFVLPTVKSLVLASPDETAAYIISSRISNRQTAAIAEPLAEAFPWLHPRSWVSQGQYIVPVGFFGWPWFLSFFRTMGTKIPLFIGTLIVLSGAYPLYCLLSVFGKKGAFLGTMVFLTFPPFLLYANRSLFANGAMLAGFLWSVFLLKHLQGRELVGKKDHALILLTALVIGLTAAVRPVEMLWILPWLVWAGQGVRYTKKQLTWFISGFILVLVPLAFQALLTYGNPMLTGYQLADNPLPFEVRSTSPGMAPAAARFDHFLPYGFHPRNILWNIRSFFLSYLWAWMVPLGIFFILSFKTWKRPKTWRDFLHPTWLSLWSALVLLVIYGSGLYMDNIRVGAVTIGNSFLRYTLPLVVAVAVAVAYSWKRVAKNNKLAIPFMLFVVLLSAFGIYKGMNGDDESILVTRPELERYAEVRASAKQWFSAKDIILSERSDKIFFPAFKTVSPLPPQSEIGRLVNTVDAQVGLYVRPISQKEKDAWKKFGVDVIELDSFAREKLYLLRPQP